MSGLCATPSAWKQAPGRGLRRLPGRQSRQRLTEAFNSLFKAELICRKGHSDRNRQDVRPFTSSPRKRDVTLKFARVNSPGTGLARCHLIANILGGKGKTLDGGQDNLVPCRLVGMNAGTPSMRTYEYEAQKTVGDANFGPNDARTATRLHPRPGSPSPHDSSVGGPHLWPTDEPCPYCDGPHVWDQVNAALSPEDVRLQRRIRKAVASRPYGTLETSRYTPEERAIDERINAGRIPQTDHD